MNKVTTTMLNFAMYTWENLFCSSIKSPLDLFLYLIISFSTNTFNTINKVNGINPWKIRSHQIVYIWIYDVLSKYVLLDIYLTKFVSIIDGSSSSYTVWLNKNFSFPHSDSKNFVKLSEIENTMIPMTTAFVDIHDFELYKRGLHITKYLSILNATVK